MNTEKNHYGAITKKFRKPTQPKEIVNVRFDTSMVVNVNQFCSDHDINFSDGIRTLVELGLGKNK